MNRLVHLLLLGPTLLLTTGCGEDAADRRASDAGIAVEHTEGGETIPDLATAHDHAAGDAEEALPLRPIMQRLASDMAGFTYALWLEDYAAMAERAAAMAAHSTISAEEIGRLQAELGPEMAAFEQADEAVHLSLVALHEAAGTGKVEPVLERLAEVQQGCMSCHTQFRARLRTDSATAVR